MSAFRHRQLTCLIPILMMQVAYASTDTTAESANDVPTVVLEGDEVTIRRRTSQVGESVITDQQIERQMVSDTRDLVRYETGVSVVETGRMGSSGFSIRGVDENRVAIMVDGLHQAQTLSSQGFKELFEGYGNFNNTRNSVEVEHLSRATIAKGADSVKVGSGGLGGSVMFTTKDARDFLYEKDYHISHKIGYATANNELINSTTLAGRFANVDALIIHTKREGNELENYGYDSYDGLKQGREREKADPYDISRDSWLAKLSYTHNDNHRLTLVGDVSKRRSMGNDFSYALNASDYYDREETRLRHTDDKSERKMFGFVYENSSSTPLWDTLKLSYSDQKIDNIARTDDYCDGNESCNDIANPMGWQVQDGRIVDKDGNLPTVSVENYSSVVSINGEKIASDTYSLNRRINQSWFDCAVFDCQGSIWGYHRGIDDDSNPTYTLTEYKFDPSKIVTDHDGKQYARPEGAGYSDYLLTPIGHGYLERLYKQRTLTTNTKQFNLDLEKYWSLGNTSHDTSYGLIYNKTDTSMVNQEGAFAYLPQWWAQGFIGLRKDGVSLYDSCEQAKDTANVDRWHSRNTNTYACPSDSPLMSFLIPVTTKTGAVYFGDKIRINDKLAPDVGYRYDKVKYQSTYVDGVSPAIPDDMVKGLFVPLPERTHGSRPNWWDYDSVTDPAYLSALEIWNQAEAQYQAAVESNPAQNIAYLSQPKKYSAHSYAIGAMVDASDFLKLQFKYSKGFRAPTVDEMYFTFKHPDFTILPNINLRPEIAKNKEFSLTVHDDIGHLSAGVFRTDYDDFLNLDYLGQRGFANAYDSNIPTLQHQIYQNVNMDKAVVKGFEVDARVNLAKVLPMANGVNVTYKYTEQEGRMNGDIPMNAIAPRTSVIGIGYDHSSQKFGGNLYVTHVAEKRAEDTYNMFHEEEGADTTQMKWRSGKYHVWDLIAYVKPTDNVTLQAGVYNLFNEKYMTWESARSIRSFGVSNMINQETGMGIHRFYAPERHFKISAEFRF